MPSTRSRIEYSPYGISPIIVSNFNLDEAIKQSIEAASYEDDVNLTSPPLDHSATLFWSSASEIQPLFKHERPLDTQIYAVQRSPSPNHYATVQSTHDAFQSNTCSTNRHNTFTGKNSRNVRIHAKRAKRQAAEAKRHGLGYHPPRPEVAATHVTQSSAIQTDFTSDTLRHETSGFTANTKRPHVQEGKYVKSLEELQMEGYKLIEWDGITCRPIICSKGRIFAVLVGQPNPETGYNETCHLAYEAIMKEGSSAYFNEAEIHHCRGNFPAVNVGVTMGLGATYPTNLNFEGPHAEMLNRLLENCHIQRIAHFADGAFNLLAPKLYEHYYNHLNTLFDNLPYLRHIFPKSVFPAAAFNFGGNVFTKAHRDCMNYAIGWCAIQALGVFDPKKSGHFVLPDLKLIIEFPPGALILMPSAANLPVSKGESRVSFTQYCAGGLFRYIINGFCTETELQKRDHDKYMKIMDLKVTRWDDNLKLYSIFKECALPVNSLMHV
ncbi:hypothetical protein C0992_000144 [Termitomyces sp. T32_za158]|nr:hypothetical protein C0992_000144 [Termitomyces sp. T32_za158]